MPCCLTPSTGTQEDFLGKVACDVAISVQGPAGVNVAILHARYAGKEIDPPQFKIENGAKLLVVLAEASQAGALIQLMETCGAGPAQVLDRFHFDPMNPARGYIVRGTAA